MPILLYKDNAHVASRLEFINEYKKLVVEDNSILKRITDPFDFEKSVFAMSNIYSRVLEKKKLHTDEGLYSFDYHDDDAKDIALELILFFSEFYHKLKIFDSSKNLLSIKDFLLPHRILFFNEKSHFVITDGLLHFTIYLSQIKRVKGLVNNFIFYLDNLIIHFCSDISVDIGTYISLEPAVKDVNGKIHYQINDCDYLFKRNKPNRYKLLKFRRKGFIFVIL
jgi:hypothetical protein